MICPFQGFETYETWKSMKNELKENIPKSEVF